MKRWKELEHAVANLLMVRGYLYHRVDNYRCYKCGAVQNRKATGWPDFFVYFPKLFAVECKTGAGKLTRGQRETKKHLELSGVEYIVCQDTVDKLINYLEKEA